MSPSADAHPLLESSKALIRAGRNEEAQTLLLQVIQENPNNGRAWYAYSFVADDLERKIDAIEKTLILRPDSRRATHRLRSLTKLRNPDDSVTDNDIVPDVPTAYVRSNRLAPHRKHGLPRALLITGVIVAGTFVVLMVLSITTLLEASKPQTLPTLLPLGQSGETSAVYPNQLQP